jgi:hypothetical protein
LYHTSYVRVYVLSREVDDVYVLPGLLEESLRGERERPQEESREQDLAPTATAERS